MKTYRPGVPQKRGVRVPDTSGIVDVVKDVAWRSAYVVGWSGMEKEKDALVQELAQCASLETYIVNGGW